MGGVLSWGSAVEAIDDLDEGGEPGVERLRRLLGREVSGPAERDEDGVGDPAGERLALGDAGDGVAVPAEHESGYVDRGELVGQVGGSHRLRRVPVAGE